MSGAPSLTPERWAEVQTRFFELLDQPEGERARRLAALADADPTLAAEVRSLLSAHDEGPLSPEIAPPPSPTPPPERIGPYRILRPLGEGGMGVVYLAERDGAGFTQRVAINFDLANLLNRNDILGVTTTYGAAWQTPTAILDPRLFKLGVQFDF